MTYFATATSISIVAKVAQFRNSGGAQWVEQVD